MVSAIGVALDYSAEINGHAPSKGQTFKRPGIAELFRLVTN